MAKTLDFAIELQQVFKLTEDQAAALLEVERKFKQWPQDPVDPMGVIVDALIALEDPELWLHGRTHDEQG